jgi:ABC-type Na+ transport system ATPase subunit NatA
MAPRVCRYPGRRRAVHHHRRVRPCLHNRLIELNKQFSGFLGPNGAGKSTTIRCLTGLLRPTAGTMRILGLDPAVDPVAIKRRIGVVPEDLGLFDRLTAQETLTFVAQVHGLDAATARSRSADLLDVMDLDSAGTTLVTDFSHGMRKKLSLAASRLLHQPALAPVLLLAWCGLCYGISRLLFVWARRAFDRRRENLAMLRIQAEDS